MAAETVDRLEIEIRSRADAAAEKVEKLASSIEAFGANVSKYIGDLKVFAGVLDQIANATKNLSGIRDLKNVLNGFAKTTKSGKAGQLD